MVATSWSSVVESYGVSAGTTVRLVGALRACEAAALAFCRLLDAWARGEPRPSTAGQRQAALRRAGVAVAPHRVAQAYLELAVFVRALEGLTASARFASAPDRGSLWAGLFDLRENLGGAADDLRALAA